MLSEAKKIARLRLIKRIGLIGLAASGAVGLTIFILSLLPQGNAAFTIRVDNPGLVENETFHIFTNSRDAHMKTPGKAVTYLSGDPVTNAALTESKLVEDFIASKAELEGSTNYVVGDTEEAKKELAMIYTIYLTNNTDEEVGIKYAIRLDGYKQTSNNVITSLEYFRVLVQTETVDEADTLTNTYYGQRRSSANETKYVFDNNEGRETIGAPLVYLGAEDLKQHVTVDDTWSSPGNDGYCVNFNDYRITKDIVSSEVRIPVNKVVRYTIALYFEGGDIDSYIRAQADDYLLLSLHFGV